MADLLALNQQWIFLLHEEVKEIITQVWLVALTLSTTAARPFFIAYLNISNAIACFKHWLNPSLAGPGSEGCGQCFCLTKPDRTLHSAEGLLISTHPLPHFLSDHNAVDEDPATGQARTSYLIAAG